jgi:hypothetical protein
VHHGIGIIPSDVAAGDATLRVADIMRSARIVIAILFVGESQDMTEFMNCEVSESVLVV